MKFSKLSESIKEIDEQENLTVKSVSIEDIETKQRLSLSKRSRLIIERDAELFKESQNYSHLINRIIRVYAERADASISRVLKREEAVLKHSLKSIDKSARRNAIELLLCEKEKQLKKKAENLIKRKGASQVDGKDVPCQIRIDRENLKWLGREGISESKFYNDRIGLYIKALVEEYADLPYVEREKLFFYNHINSVNSAKEDKVILKIRLHTKNKNFEDGVIRDNIIYMKPYKIATDSESLYNYIIGITKVRYDDTWSDTSKISSIRLSSIKECKCMETKASISKTEATKIESEIEKRGVQFLSSDGARKIVVQFTETGEKMYQRMLHLRPSYTSKKNNREYEFYCTDEQATNYFFKFGHHVKIIEPVYLADLFGRRYRSAAMQYSEK